MAKLKDLTGSKFGDWLVTGRAQSKINGSGATVTYWWISCLKCGNEFEMGQRAITRRKSEPVGCSSCSKKKSPKVRGRTVHWKAPFNPLPACGVSSAYSIDTSDNRHNVTCDNCLKVR